MTNQSVPRAISSGTEDDPWGKELIAGRSVGYGAYRLVERDDEGVTIAAHDGYWRGRAPIGEVRLQRYDSRDEALEGLLAGEVDLDDVNAFLFSAVQGVFSNGPGCLRGGGDFLVVDCEGIDVDVGRGIGERYVKAFLVAGLFGLRRH